MKKAASTVIGLLLVATLATGCATPLGRQYGLAGGAAGAIIGGAAGGLKGAIIGGAAGAATGGIIGDQQQLERERREHTRDRSYVRPCTPEREQLYDRHGRVAGFRRICR